MARPLDSNWTKRHHGKIARDAICGENTEKNPLTPNEKPIKKRKINIQKETTNKKSSSIFFNDIETEEEKLLQIGSNNNKRRREKQTGVKKIKDAKRLIEGTQ